MELTKVECEKVLEELILNCGYLGIEEDLLPIKQLIKEHFDNKPLKFEELKEGMWVWDKKTKSYIFIFKPLNWEPVKGIRYAERIIYYSSEGYFMEF